MIWYFFSLHKTGRGIDMAEGNYQEIVNEIVLFLDAIKNELPDNVMSMYFVEKPARDKYLS